MNFSKKMIAAVLMASVLVGSGMVAQAKDAMKSKCCTKAHVCCCVDACKNSKDCCCKKGACTDICKKTCDKACKGTSKDCSKKMSDKECKAMKDCTKK